MVRGHHEQALPVFVVGAVVGHGFLGFCIILDHVQLNMISLHVVIMEDGLQGGGWLAGSQGGGLWLGLPDVGE